MSSNAMMANYSEYSLKFESRQPSTRDGKQFRRKILRKTASLRQGEQLRLEAEDKVREKDSSHLENDIYSEGRSDFDSDEVPVYPSLTSTEPQNEHAFDVQEYQTHAYESICKRLSVTPVDHFIKEMHTTEIVLNYHQIGPIGARAIAIALVDNTTVNSLNLTGCGLGDEGAGYILDMLSENLCLSSISLVQNDLKTDTAKKLCDTMCNNTLVVKLDVSKNEFKDSDGTYFATILQKNENLEELNLAHNAFGEMTGHAFSQAVDTNDSLKVLDLSWNHFRKKGGIALISGLRSNTSLKRINLAWNGLAAEGCLVMGEVLEENSTLTHVDMTANRVNLLAFRLLTNGIIKNTTLRVLKIGTNPITTAGAMEILRAVGQTEGCAVEELDLTNVSVGGEFNDLLIEIQLTRPLIVRHGTTLRHDELLSVETSQVTDSEDPCMLLFKYMKQENMRLIDLYNFLDRKKRGFITREDFRDGFANMNMTLSSRSLSQLMRKLDIDKDGEVLLEELFKISKEYTRKIRKINRQEERVSFHSIVRQKMQEISSNRSTPNPSEEHSSGNNGNGRKISLDSHTRYLDTLTVNSVDYTNQNRTRRPSLPQGHISNAVQSAADMFKLKLRRRKMGISYPKKDTSYPQGFLPSVNQGN